MLVVMGNAHHHLLFDPHADAELAAVRAATRALSARIWSMTKAGRSSVMKWPQPLERMRLDVRGDHRDHFAHLRAQTFFATERDDRNGHLVSHQRFGLLDAGKGRAVDAHASEHTLWPGKCAQIFVDRRRRDCGVVDDVLACEEPIEKGAFVADDQRLGDARGKG